MTYSRQDTASLRRRFEDQVDLPESFLDYGEEHKLEKKLYECIFVKSLSRAQWLISLVAIAFASATMLAFPNLLGSSLLTVGTSVAGHVLLIAVAWFVLARLWSIFCAPTHLGVSNQGVRLHWKKLPWQPASRLITWSSMTRIFLHQPRGTMLVEQQYLTFVSPGCQQKLLLKKLHQSEQRKLLFDVICQYAPREIRDFDISVLLGTSNSTTYTEIWLQALSAPPERERTAPLAPFATVKEGAYEIVERLGMGGQGTAYAAIRKVDSRGNQTTEHVVLKEYILPIQVSLTAKKQSLEKLENEARLLKELNHPLVVKLIDFFVEDHRGYLVLEHIRGGNLRQWVAERGTLAPVGVCRLAVKMCEILQYLHSQSPAVVHRDFTPDNLLFTPDGELKLIDFNVAHQRSATTTASVVGKHAYIPPEQFRGKPVPESDIYALGATLFFLVTGKDPRPLTACRPSMVMQRVPQELDDLIYRCMSMECSARASLAEIKQIASALMLSSSSSSCRIPSDAVPT